jgi:hypothetical protein
MMCADEVAVCYLIASWIVNLVVCLMIFQVLRINQ